MQLLPAHWALVLLQFQLSLWLTSSSCHQFPRPLRWELPCCFLKLPCSLVPILSLPPLPAEPAAVSAAFSDFDDEEAAAEAEEAGFGQFSIPEFAPEESVTVAAVPTATNGIAVTMPVRSAAAPFPYKLDISEANLSRRLAQVAAAQTRMQSLHDEVDACATKLFQLSQLTQRSEFAHLELAQLLQETLAGAS
jgi:hypothetical protein